MNLAEIRMERSEPAALMAAARAVGMRGQQEWLEHLAAGPDGAAIVASREGDALGFALGYRRDEAWILAHLAVREGLRGEGLGGALLAAAIAPFETLSRTAIVPAGSKDALSLVARRAMVPQGALLELAGPIPGERELAEIAAGEYRFETTPLIGKGAGPLAALNALDREIRGVVRSQDHAWFADRASGVTFALGGELVGYGYAWPDGTIGPIAATSPTYLPQMIAYMLHLATGAHRASWARLLVPGTCGRALRLLLRVGLRIEEEWWWCAEAAPDLARYLAFRPEAP
ncbi:MAG: GNAT family N-acetyltransferase [bacterium]|nr:GNAT family N-acetyltransferase [bacterium]